MTRLLAWDDCRNARHVGGYATVEGRVTRDDALIRADSLARLTEDGRRAVVEHGVSLVIDLRGHDELRHNPNPFGPGRSNGHGPRFLHAPLIDVTDRAAMARLDYSRGPVGYYPVILDRFRRQVGIVARAIADAPTGPVIVHCHAGKDRTGIVVAVLLALVGVPSDAIAADYGESEINLASVIQQWLTADPNLNPIEMASPAAVMQSLLDRLDREHGGPVAYLRAAGATETELASLRDRFLA